MKRIFCVTNWKRGWVGWSFSYRTPFARLPQRGIPPCSCFGIEKQALKRECTSICWLKLSADLSTHSSFSSVWSKSGLETMATSLIATSSGLGSGSTQTRVLKSECGGKSSIFPTENAQIRKWRQMTPNLAVEYSQHQPTPASRLVTCEAQSSSSPKRTHTQKILPAKIFINLSISRTLQVRRPLEV